jgi:hypothetical protein
MRRHFDLATVLTLSTFLVGNAFAQGVTWFSPGPITKIQSTYIIPSVPKVPIMNATQGFWMGMQPIDNDAVIQNVVGNRGETVGQWGFWPEYCCEPNVFLDTSKTVYPGDQLVNSIAQNSTTGEWVMSWWLKPGTEGGQARESPFAGSFVFDPKLYPSQNPFQNAFFLIEVGQESYWDFGMVMWEDISIEAKTTEINWCSNPSGAMHSTSNPWTVTPPNATVSDGVTTCRVGALKLSGP